MLDASDPNNATCDKWAMHSTSSGHINYVGFGTSFNQVAAASTRDGDDDQEQERL